jgi:hypothetical protein
VSDHYRYNSFHGEFSSADARALTEATTARIRLYGPGSATALAVGAADKVVITDITLSSTEAGPVDQLFTIYDGANATPVDGEILLRVFLGPTTGGDASISVSLKNPLVCQAGTVPKVASSAAGQVYVSCTGYIAKE